MTAVCTVCGKEFEKRSNNVKTCGVECRKENKRQWVQNYQATPDRIESQRQGWRRRRLAAQGGPTIIACMICGKEFRKGRHSLTCSPECSAIRRRPSSKPEPVIQPFPRDIDRDQFGHWLAGFTDGEGTFVLSLYCYADHYHANAYFRINLRDDDTAILKLIQSYWGCGSLVGRDVRRSKVPNAKPGVCYTVYKPSKLIDTVTPHFERYALRAKKQRDFLIWRRGIELLVSVQSRPTQLRPRAPLAKHFSGTFTKWTDSERQEFGSLVRELKAQRRYPDAGVPTDVDDVDPGYLPGF